VYRLLKYFETGGGLVAAKLGMAAALEEEREAREGARDAERSEVRRWKVNQRAEMDEMLPKGTGRYAALCRGRPCAPLGSECLHGCDLAVVDWPSIFLLN